MARHFDVVGQEDEDVAGDVMGDVMGDFSDSYEGSAQVVGYDSHGYPVVVGARGRRPGPRVQLVKPGWRRSQLAPGVIAPDQGLLPLPMGNFTYVLAAQINTFQGQVQKPFRGERWLISVVRTGASAVGRILAQLFVGTDLAQLDVQQVDLEQLARPDAFGVRTTLKPAQPGVFIRAVTSLSSPLAGTDTIFASLQLLGRNVW